MYICHCNALTDRDVKQAIEAGADRPCAVYSANGCKAQCGNCAPTVLSLLRDTMTKAAESLGLYEGYQMAPGE